MNKVLFGFLKKELTQMLRNPIMVFALLFMPIVQAFLFSYAITNEPKNITIAIDAKPNDVIMNKIYTRALSSKWFVKAHNTKNNAFKTVQNGIADVVIVAPKKDLTHDLANNCAEMQILINASNVLKAQSISGYMQGIVAEVLHDELKKHNINDYVNFKFVPRVLFNPQMDTKIFIVPAIMVMIIMSTILSLICIAIAKEKEIGTMETLISAPIRKTDIILGKTLPYVGVALFNMLSILLIGLFIFHVPFRGHIDQFLLSFIIFCYAIGMLGVFLSTLCKTQQQAMLLLMMTAFIIMMLSGSMFPIENMPKSLQFFANINPLAHYTFLVRNIMLKGSSWTYFFQHAIPILCFGIIFTVLGLTRFKQTLQ